MCAACDRQIRVCPDGHTQPKRHGDVFTASPLPCETCGKPTKIVEKEER